jgi:hypothetical protein
VARKGEIVIAAQSRPTKHRPVALTARQLHYAFPRSKRPPHRREVQFGTRCSPRDRGSH